MENKNENEMPVCFWHFSEKGTGISFIVPYF